MFDGRYLLVLNATRQMHNQHLSCSALNSAGVTEDIVVLNINCILIIFLHFLCVLYFEIDSPEFKSFPSPYTLARLGDSLTLSCIVDSNPPANILWTKNGDFVGGGNQYQITDVHEDDYAVYACIAAIGGHFTKIIASTKVHPPGLFRLALVSMMMMMIDRLYPRTSSFLSTTTCFGIERL